MLGIVLSGAFERLEHEQQGRAWLAWHIAALPRLKKFPTLDSLMGVKRQGRRQTLAEMDALFRAWAGKA